jgi:hypothetical protein
MMRLISCLLLFALGLTLWWPLFIVCAFVYAFWFEGLELIGIGFLLDAYFGHSTSTLPLHAAYSIACTGLLILVWGLKPLMFLSHTDDSFV